MATLSLAFPKCKANNSPSRFLLFLVFWLNILLSINYLLYSCNAITAKLFNPKVFVFVSVFCFLCQKFFCFWFKI